MGTKGKKAKLFCKWCCIEGHATTRNKKCKFFQWSDEEIHAEVVRINLNSTVGGEGVTATSDESLHAQLEGTYYF